MLGIDDQEIQSFWGDDLIYMVQLQSPIALYHLNPKLHEIAQLDRRALCVSVINDGTFGEAIDYASRYFAPKVGIYEDPVCGSSHCRLAPFWAQRLKKNELIAYQASSRGGVLRLWVDELHQRVHISGQAITVGRGVLNPKSLETLYQ
jgi:PhzF family phenazine biosynthesis protein